MKFHTVTTAAAVGAILAHSEQAGDTRIRKGQVLSADHVEALQKVGITQLTVAELEPGDVTENDAAAKLGASLVAPGLSLSTPFTGRVNVNADAPGVIQIDACKIVAANQVDPMITISTVPDCYQVDAGQMVATVKIIPYAVAKDNVQRAFDVLKGAIQLAVPVYQTASLIISQKTPENILPKDTSAISSRLERLGMRLLESLTAAHTAANLADAITAAEGDIVLILTATATSDPRDIGPEALRHAGGKVTRVGMPVDPGTLLFLGDLNDKHVIGLPGSARSPVLHGADRILSRLACGLTPNDQDFAEMAVGGLLKELPTRPQPRRRK